MSLITVTSIRKAFGRVQALDDVSFVVRAGAVTGLLGPNGAGKTTTLRILLGLAHADSGTALIDGKAYAELEEPLRTVGAVGEDVRFHPARSGRDHLRLVAATVDAAPRPVPTSCSSSSTSGTTGGGRSAATRSGCASGSRSRAPCCPTPACSCSTSR